MPRYILEEARLHPAIRDAVAGNEHEIVDAVMQAVATHAIVVVGMAQNPFPKKVRKALTDAGFAFHYLEYGSYLKDWRPRLALKMWTGWPTFPMVFVKGTLVGGAEGVAKLIQSGELKSLVG